MTVKFSWNISVKIHFNFLNVVGWVSQYLTHHWCMKFLWKRFYHETACSQQYLPAVLCETCTILACYQCACLALVRYWPWLLCGEANVLFKCASCCGEWLGWRCWRSEAQWCRLSLGDQCWHQLLADFQKACQCKRLTFLRLSHHTVPGPVQAPDRPLASLTPVTQPEKKKDWIKTKTWFMCWCRWLWLRQKCCNKRTYIPLNVTHGQGEQLCYI